MHNLTPFSGLIGGALIGLASALLMLLTGRIAGISGIFGGLLPLNATDRIYGRYNRIASPSRRMPTSAVRPVRGATVGRASTSQAATA